MHGTPYHLKNKKIGLAWFFIQVSITSCKMRVPGEGNEKVPLFFYRDMEAMNSQLAVAYYVSLMDIISLCLCLIFMYLMSCIVVKVIYLHFEVVLVFFCGCLMHNLLNLTYKKFWSCNFWINNFHAWKEKNIMLQFLVSCWCICGLCICLCLDNSFVEIVHLSASGI